MENQIRELKGKKCEKANKQKSFCRRQVSECSGILLLRCRTYKEAKKTSSVGNTGRCMCSFGFKRGLRRGHQWEREWWSVLSLDSKMTFGLFMFPFALPPFSCLSFILKSVSHHLLTHHLLVSFIFTQFSCTLPPRHHVHSRHSRQLVMRRLAPKAVLTKFTALLCG